MSGPFSLQRLSVDPETNFTTSTGDNNVEDGMRKETPLKRNFYKLAGAYYSFSLSDHDFR